MFDLSVLPEKAQNELKDFYQFLVERYGFKNEEESVLVLRKKKDSCLF